eukprot:433285_1
MNTSLHHQYMTLEQMKSVEINHIKTTMAQIEQRYAQYFESILDIKKRLTVELYATMQNRVTEIYDKQIELVNTYYQEEVKQLRRDKDELTRKNVKYQRLIHYYQTQTIEIDTRSKISHDNTTINTSIDKKHNSKNPFQFMPKFNANPCATNLAVDTNSVMNNVALSEPDQHSDSSSTCSEQNEQKEEQHSDVVQKRNRKTQNPDRRHRWVWCNHLRAEGDENELCGLQYLRTLKNLETRTQHCCFAQLSTKTKMTRTIGKTFKRCVYCDGSKPCIRLATVDEIEKYEFEAMSSSNQEVSSHIDTDTDSEWTLSDEDEEAMDVEGTANDTNIDNKPLKSGSRKRTRENVSTLCDVEPLAKKQKFDRSEIRKMNIDDLLSKIYQYNEKVNWAVNDEWCRYCGARGSPAFLSSPWGAKKLCQKHNRLWKSNELNLTWVDEPVDIEHVIDKATCTEKTFLVNLLVKLQRLDENARKTPRRSLRNIRNKGGTPKEKDIHTDNHFTDIEIHKKQSDVTVHINDGHHGSDDTDGNNEKVGFNVKNAVNDTSDSDDENTDHEDEDNDIMGAD